MSPLEEERAYCFAHVGRFESITRDALTYLS